MVDTYDFRYVWVPDINQNTLDVFRRETCVPEAKGTYDIKDRYKPTLTPGVVVPPDWHKWLVIGVYSPGHVNFMCNKFPVDM